MDKGRFDWVYKALLEGGLIVFAVVLGFAVNEWREHRGELAGARDALERIALELEANIAELEQTIPYHREVGTSLRGELERLGGDAEEERGVFMAAAQELAPQGVRPPQLSSSAWAYALERGALDPLDYALVADLASTYRLLDAGVEKTWRALVDKMFLDESAMMEAPLAPRLQLFALMLGELRSQQEYLLAKSRAALEDVDAWLEE